MKLLIIKVRKVFLFQFFGIRFFTIRVWGSKIQTYSEFLFAGIYCFVIPTSGECQKLQLVLKFPDVVTHFFPQKHKVLFLNLGPTRMLFTCTRALIWKIFSFVLCVRILIKRQCEKSVISSEKNFEIQKFYPSITTGSIPFIKFTIESPELVVNHYIEKLLILCLASESW